MVCLAEMLPGRQGPKIGYDQLSQYIEGWLQYKENKKYVRFWFVLRGNILNERDLVTAYLFCFKDLNIHVEENAVGSIEIHAQDKVEFLKCTGNRPMKCDFTIMLSETKFHFRADDEISRERWIYAFCELIGKRLPPAELPTERNQIRTSLTSPKKSVKKVGPFHRSKTVELPTLRGNAARPREFRSVSLATGGSSSLVGGSSSLRYLSSNLPSNLSLNDAPPLVPPPRSGCSLPFMLDPSAADLKDIPWFYPGMRRDEAQERLEKCPPGYYLLRDSESKMGSYTLAFKDVDRIKNHMITQTPLDGQYRFIKSEVESSFPTPQKAVEFYMIKKHSKTLTPTPYIEKKKSLGDGDDRDYLLPEQMNLNSSTGTQQGLSRKSQSCEMNLNSPTPLQGVSRTAQSCGYTHRELPPTPTTLTTTTDINTLRKLSIKENDVFENDDDAYLRMGDEVVEETKRYSTHTFKKQSEVDVEEHFLEENSSVVNLGNEYTKEPPLLYGKEISLDDDESYLLISNHENMMACVKDGNSVSKESDSASGDDDHDYFEYEKHEGEGQNHQNEGPNHQNGDSDGAYVNSEIFDEAPSLPVKPDSFKKEYSFSHYDDVSLSYENQCVIENAVGATTDDAPPIPPRCSTTSSAISSGLPPRRESSFPT